MNPVIAAIDIGTNSFHLVLARFDRRKKKFVLLDRAREIVRLGSGCTDMKHLSRGAMLRGIATLKRFNRIAEDKHALIRAVGTSAVREALNRTAFLNRVYRETGIRVEVISGFEEARLIYLGILQSLPLLERRILLVDIGGGSTEFLVGKHCEVLFSNSLKLGAIRLTRRFFGKAVTRKSVRKCRNFITGSVDPIARESRRHGFELAVGSSGTIMTAAAMIHHRRTGKPARGTNGLTFTRDELADLIDRVLSAGKPGEIARMPGMDTGRADIFTAGLLILEQVFEAFALRELHVSDAALREGVLIDTAEKHYDVPGRNYLVSVRRRSIAALLADFSSDQLHFQHVRDLALQLFDQTRRLHGMGDREREYLEYAALLHDIGIFLSHSQHHQHSYYLIRNAELIGFTENEKEILANIARYHRKSHPKLKHEAFALLSPDDRTMVRKLSALLRIADGLDRSHAARITGIRCRRAHKDVLCTVRSGDRSSPAIELWGAESKKDLFEETFGSRITFRGPR